MSTTTLYQSASAYAEPAPPGGPARLLAATAPGLPEHARRNGPLPWRGGPGRLLAEVSQAGLTGRGGAGFPTARKLAAVGAASRHLGRIGQAAPIGDRPVVVANGAEGEPASAKDRTLLVRAPHLVLDGLQLAAECVGADVAYVYVGRRGADAVRAALAERRAAGWDAVSTTVVPAPDRFVAGEESAAVAAIEGRAALPRDKSRRVVEAGVHGRPTLVQNVETLAHLALIARHGAAWFRCAGTATEPGTFLATVSGAVGAPGVYEAAYGTPLGGLLTAAGGPTEPLRALLVGGFHGAWVPASAAGVAMSRAALAPLGASPGAGVLVALPASRCGLAETARIVSYLASQSAGQCGPCRYGLPRVSDTLTRLVAGDRDPGLAAEVHRLTGLVEGRGACHHPDATARFVRGGLAAFADEVDRHLAGRCGAGDRGYHAASPR